MSGCCGQGPVIVSGASATPRVDVEAVLLCDVLPDGTVAATVLVEPIYDTISGERVGTRIVDPATGATYAPVGTIQLCAANPECASLTTPVTTVGLCLADGTPIAVTIVRDCDGAVTGEGWINLTTGAYSAGAAPAGTGACGDSQSVQVAGTFCDVDGTGAVVGLVLIEYNYAADGTIDSVRLVDAVTGATYTPSGTITTCPAGAAQPEQDAIVLCDVQADGTSVPFVRDYRRDENGAVTGHSDYTLGGDAYLPTGTAADCGVVPETCATAVQTFRLCDLNPEAEPNPDGLRCATPFLRHYTYDCDGSATFYDTEMDGSTPYMPVEVVDCGDSPPSLREQVWNTVSVAADPADATGATFIYTVSDSEDPTQTGTVKMTASEPRAEAAPPPTAPVWNAGVTFVIEPDATVQQLATVLRVDAIDWDGFEDKFIPSGGPASGGTWPVPDRVESALGHTNVTPTRWHSLASDNTGHFYFSGPPAAVAMGNRNDGGGLACVAPAFGFITLVPGPPCGGCQNCETLVLCDVSTMPPVAITGSAASGTLTNGVSWTATSANSQNRAMPPNRNTSDGAWWGLHSFPNAVDAPTKWTFSRPSIVEFSIYLRYSATNSAINHAQLPAGLEVVHLPAGYLYDGATGVLTRTAGPVDPCTYVTNPQVETSARFRTTGDVTSITTAPAPGSRVAACGIFFTYWAGAITVAPGGQFLRRVCHDCDGTVTSVTDTELDGTTPYVAAGTVGVCTDPLPCDKTVLSECVYRLPDTPAGFDVSQATFSDCWLGTAQNPTYTYGNRVTSWEGTYQSSTGTVSAVGFTSPDLGGTVDFTAFTPAIPANPTQTTSAYVGTATLNGITVTLTALVGNGLTRQSNSALFTDPGDRIRIAFSKPVRLTVTTTAFADPPTPHNERLCGVIAETVPWHAVKLADCEGMITVVDQETRLLLPANATVDCDCCQPVAVCIEQTPTQVVEFISNETHREDNSVDPVWKWTTNLARPTHPGTTCTPARTLGPRRGRSATQTTHAPPGGCPPTRTATAPSPTRPRPMRARRCSTRTGMHGRTSTSRPTPTPAASRFRRPSSTPTRSPGSSASTTGHGSRSQQRRRTTARHTPSGPRPSLEPRQAATTSTSTLRRRSAGPPGSWST